MTDTGLLVLLTIIGTTTPGQSVRVSNGNEGVFYTSQSSGTGAIFTSLSQAGLFF